MRAAEFLYGTAPGRVLLRGLCRPWFSKLGGWVLSTRLSALAVGPFIRTHGIDMTQCAETKFASFNDFFTRRLPPAARPADMDPAAFISPCDGRLTVWPADAQGRFPVKGTDYNLAELLRDEALAKRFYGGLVWLFRLSPEDYHRYIWTADGKAGERVSIPGVLHTVQPLARGQRPVYHENTRQYRLLDTAFGPMAVMEVGALLVGKIEDEPIQNPVRRGMEKGHFAFGGSTIILVTPPGAASPLPAIAGPSARGEETPVKQGQRVGTVMQKASPVQGEVPSSSEAEGLSDNPSVTA